MFIAVAANGQDLESLVAEELVSCRYLLIIDFESLEIHAIKNEFDPHGKRLSQEIVEHDCEAVITGALLPEAFDILAEGCVTRYDGRDHSVNEALVLMDKYALKLIRNPEGTDDCVSEHTVGSCEDHTHEHE